MILDNLDNLDNWDTKAKAEAYAQFGGGWDDTGQFEDGAKWQRSSLRTDEAVERVAQGICRRNWPKDSDFEHYWRRYGDDFRADARAAITALLGDH